MCLAWPCLAWLLDVREAPLVLKPILTLDILFVLLALIIEKGQPKRNEAEELSFLGSPLGKQAAQVGRRIMSWASSFSI